MGNLKNYEVGYYYITNSDCDRNLQVDIIEATDKDDCKRRLIQQEHPLKIKIDSVDLLNTEY